MAGRSRRASHGRLLVFRFDRLSDPYYALRRGDDPLGPARRAATTSTRCWRAGRSSPGESSGWRMPPTCRGSCERQALGVDLEPRPPPDWVDGLQRAPLGCGELTCSRRRDVREAPTRLPLLEELVAAYQDEHWARPYPPPPLPDWYLREGRVVAVEADGEVVGMAGKHAATSSSSAPSSSSPKPGHPETVWSHIFHNQGVKHISLDKCQTKEHAYWHTAWVHQTVIRPLTADTKSMAQMGLQCIAACHRWCMQPTTKAHVGKGNNTFQHMQCTPL